MARRKSRKSPTRRRSRGVNVVDVAQTYLQTAIVTRAAFNTNPVEFLTGVQTLSGERFLPSNNGEQPGTETYSVRGYFPNSNGTAITLPELFGFDKKDSMVDTPFGGGGMEAIRANIEANGGIFKPIMQTVVLNVGFAVGRKVFSKQRTLMNKGAKLANISSMVRF